MIGLRVSKYNPDCRNVDNAYTKEDWTSISDIGHRFDKQILTATKYLEIENQYVQTITELMDMAGIQVVKIEEPEINSSTGHIPSVFREETQRLKKEFLKSTAIEKSKIGNLARLALREVLWCKISGEKNFYIHFGYDFYVYIGFLDPVRIETWTPPEGIFIEEFPSPYFVQ